MKRGWLFWTIFANLTVLIGLAFAYPHLMISPGPLIKGHAALTTNCFACHTTWHGTTVEKCTGCHALPEIGLRTTTGVVRPQHGIKTSFHQQLTEQNCMACHSDHAGPRLTRRNNTSFSHALLRPDVRKDCAACHDKPKNEMHRTLTVGCAQCHQSEAWKPATFKHDALEKTVLARCEACHKIPADKLHAQIQGNCAQCHATRAWKPATFEHSKFFHLDKDHNVTCVTCHIENDYKRYTCYGCHEHTLANIRRKHEKEGISNFANCVNCHRDASGEREGGEREGRNRD
ncbi:MAG: cytochrome c3 family protein [Betaproteobacteria bacterium]